MLKSMVPKQRDPELAVFWYIPETITFVGDRGDIAESLSEGDMCRLGYNHQDRWDVWRKGQNLLKVEYDHYPRGQVMFDMRRNKFRVECDRCILDKDTVKQALCREYGLDVKKVIWAANDEYTCNVCRREN